MCKLLWGKKNKFQRDRKRRKKYQENIPFEIITAFRYVKIIIIIIIIRGLSLLWIAIVPQSILLPSLRTGNSKGKYTRSKGGAAIRRSFDKSVRFVVKRNYGDGEWKWRKGKTCRDAIIRVTELNRTRRLLQRFKTSMRNSLWISPFLVFLPPSETTPRKIPPN